MLPKPPIIIKTPYSSLSLLFGPLKWAQIIYKHVLFFKTKRKNFWIFGFITSSSFADSFSRLGGAWPCILRWLTLLGSACCVLSYLSICISACVQARSARDLDPSVEVWSTQLCKLCLARLGPGMGPKVWYEVSLDFFLVSLRGKDN